MRMGEEQEKRITEALGEPILPELDDNTLRIRRNLLVVSGIGLFLTLHDIEVRGGRFEGMVIENLTTEVITETLFFIILYNLLHFTFNSLDYVRKWRIRATGRRSYYQTMTKWGNTDHLDAENPDQTSLYGWWQRQLGKAISMEELLSKLHEHSREFTKAMAEFSRHEKADTQQATKALHQYDKHVAELSKKVGEIKMVIENRRIDVSLKRFDRWFWNYQRDQIFRLTIIEWLFPMLFGIAALYYTFPVTLMVKLIYG